MQKVSFFITRNKKFYPTKLEQKHMRYEIVFYLLKVKKFFLNWKGTLRQTFHIFFL